MNAYEPYARSTGSPSKQHRAKVRHELLVWFGSSLALGLLPFAIAAIAYRAMFEQSEGYRFPSLELLLGGGDVLLVVVTVVGASISELALNPLHLSKSLKAGALGVSGLVAFASMGLYTVIAYARITAEKLPDPQFITQLSLALLALVVLVQVLLIMTRPER